MMSILIALGFTSSTFGSFDLEHPVAVRRLHLIGLHGHRQLHAAFELPVDALDAMHVLVLDVSGWPHAHPSGSAGPPVIDRDTSLSVTPGSSKLENEAHPWSREYPEQAPRCVRRPRPSGLPRKLSKSRFTSSRHIGHAPERIPSLDGYERAPTLNRHLQKPSCRLSAGPCGSRHLLSTQVHISSECIDCQISD